MSGAVRDARFRPGGRRARSSSDHARRSHRRAGQRPRLARGVPRRHRARPLTCFSGPHGPSSARTSPSKSGAARRWRRRCSSPCPWSSCSRLPWCAMAGVVADAAAGILWIAIAFSGTLALGRTFERERYTDTLRALLLAPADRPAIYVGKLLGILAVIFVAECLLVPLVALLFDTALLARPLHLVALLVIGHGWFCCRRHVVRRDARPRAEPRRPAAGAVVSDDDSSHHCRRARHRCAHAAAAG